MYWGPVIDPTQPAGRQERRGELPERLLRAPEVAEILGVSQARVYELARQRIVPSIRLGRQIRFDPDALRRWMDDGGQRWPG
jgi:excisionase family DNA binding protein